MTVIFPDIEAVLIARLKEAFSRRSEPFASGLWVSNTMPKLANGEPTRAPRMVIVRDDSGSQPDAVRDFARVGVQFWGETREESADLAQLGRALLNGLADGQPIARVKTILRPVFVQDAQPLHYCTFEVVVRGSDL